MFLKVCVNKKLINYPATRRPHFGHAHTPTHVHKRIKYKHIFTIYAFVQFLYTEEKEV